MKVLFAGRLDGWMGVYLKQVAASFRAQDIDCITFNHRGHGPRPHMLRLVLKDWKARQRQKRTAALIRELKRQRPAVLLTHSLLFDFQALRESFDGRLVYWDMDGPAGPLGMNPLPDLSSFDLIMTISRPIQRRLVDQVTAPVHYLPHGVDISYYQTVRPNQSQESRFTSPLVFLGRPTERRINHLRPLVDEGLTVWGKRWNQPPWRSKTFHPCLREKRNIYGKDVAALYRSAGLVLNVSREAFMDPPTGLNLQVFHVPAAGSCLLTEWVEELEEAFEPDREVVVYKTPEEFVEKARKYSKDRAASQRIAEAGRKRCLSHHLMQARTSRIVELSQTI